MTSTASMSAAVLTPQVTPVECAESPVLDANAFERTAAFLPPEAVATYLRTIAERGEALLLSLHGPEPFASSQGDLIEAAHALAGSAGLLGFKLVSTAGRNFERAVQSETSETSVLALELRAAIEATLKVIRGLTSSVGET